MTQRAKVNTIYLATDHAGFTLKELIKKYLEEKEEYQVVDYGARSEVAGDDFPDYIKLAAEAISKEPDSARAVIFGASGQGEAMVANRFSNVRATVYYGGSTDIIKLSREHNDANVLSIGARFVSAEEAVEVVQLWLSINPDLDERHVRRTKKIEAITRELRK